MPLHADIDVRNPEISLLQLGRRFTPRGNFAVRREIDRRVRTPLNPMIRENCVAAVFGIAFRHVATKAVTVFGRMRSGEI